MPGTKYDTLLKIGPFEGINSSTADVDVKAGQAQTASNCDTTRSIGALSTARGRINLTTFTPTSGEIVSVDGLMQFSSPFTALRYVIGGVTETPTAYEMLAYNPDANTQTTVVNGNSFTEGMQYALSGYTNAGQVISYNGAGGLFAEAWVPSLEFLAPTVSATSGSLTAETYYYTYTQVFQFVDGHTQESPPDPNTANSPYSLSITTTGSQAINITPTTNNWGGSIAGSSLTYSTNIYRQSVGQPIWHLVANQAGANMTPYTDNAQDAAIVSSQELTYRDFPIFNGGSGVAVSFYGGAIFRHMERTWQFGMTDVPAVPQCQLWYSDYGTPWSFNATTQVILVGQSDDNTSIFYNPYGDRPMRGVSLSSVGALFKRKSTWVLYGQDETNFAVAKVGNMGCVSASSVALCETLCCWLTEQGVYAFDGYDAPVYISEDVRDTIGAVTVADQAVSVGWYADRSYYLSFPATGITLRYYLPSKQWFVLPYSASVAYSIPSDATIGTSAANKFNQVIAARPEQEGRLTGRIDSWGASYSDLGAEIVAMWTTPLSDSGQPMMNKSYKLICINHPIQTGVTAIVSMTVDPGSSPARTHFWDVNFGINTTDVINVPTDCVGYLCQVTISLPTPTSATSASLIYSVEVLGDINQVAVAVDDGAVTQIS